MSKPVVLLDPGHGGYDPGASYNGLKEKDLNLALALKVADRLDGVKVLMTRERDTYVSLADRVTMSRRAEPDLFLSLHANAGGGRGFESFIYSGLGAKDPAVGIQKAVHKEIMASLARWEIVDRGLKRASFYVLKYNPVPAVLIESLFIDNVREAGIWREPIFGETLAAGVARGVKEALVKQGYTDPAASFLPSSGGITVEGRGAVTEGSAGVAGEGNCTGGGTPADPQILYTVQVGAFAYIENARQRLSEARAAGFNDAYIYQKQV